MSLAIVNGLLYSPADGRWRSDVGRGKSAAIGVGGIGPASDFQSAEPSGFQSTPDSLRIFAKRSGGRGSLP